MKISLSSLSLILLISFVLSQKNVTENPPSDIIPSLTDETFDSALSTHSVLFIEFYISWCTYCPSFYTQFEGAAQLHPDISFFKVNLEQNNKLSTRYSIDAYPTYLLIIKNNTKFNPDSHNRVFKFRGPYIKEDFSRWLNKKTVSPIEFISTINDISQYEDKTLISLVYFGKENISVNDATFKVNDKYEKAIQIFSKFSFYEDKYRCAYININNDEQIALKYNISKENDIDTILLFKNFDHHISKYEFNKNSMSPQDFDKFVISSAYPFVMEFDDDSREIVFSRQKPGLFLIRDPANLTNSQYDDEIKKVAETLHSKLQIVISGLMNRNEPRLIDFLGLTLEDTPCVYILDTRIGFKKYLLEKQITKDNILEFVSEWEKGNLIENIKSEKEPEEENNNKPIKKLVGKTIEKMINDDEYDRVVKFYSPHCDYCVAFEPKYKRIAERFVNSTQNPYLKMYELDLTKNDIGKISIRKMPSVKIWRAHNKKNNPIDLDYDRELTELDVENFIKLNSDHQVIQANEVDNKKEEIKKPDNSKKENDIVEDL